MVGSPAYSYTWSPSSFGNLLQQPTTVAADWYCWYCRPQLMWVLQLPFSTIKSTPTVTPFFCGLDSNVVSTECSAYSEAARCYILFSTSALMLVKMVAAIYWQILLLACRWACVCYVFIPDAAGCIATETITAITARCSSRSSGAMPINLLICAGT